MLSSDVTEHRWLRPKALVKTDQEKDRIGREHGMPSSLAFPSAFCKSTPALTAIPGVSLGDADLLNTGYELLFSEYSRKVPTSPSEVHIGGREL